MNVTFYYENGRLADSDDVHYWKSTAKELCRERPYTIFVITSGWEAGFYDSYLKGFETFDEYRRWRFPNL